MSLLYIHLFIAVVDIVMFYLIAKSGAEEFKKRYPDYTISPSSSTEHALTAIRVCIISLCPLLNIALAWALTFKTEDIREGAINDILKKCHKEDEK